jgi:hypothetical protein
MTARGLRTQDFAPGGDFKTLCDRFFGFTPSDGFGHEARKITGQWILTTEFCRRARVGMASPSSDGVGALQN